MRVHLAYGRSGAVVEVPDQAQVILPTQLPALADERVAVHDAVAPRLDGLVDGATRVVVVFPDLTRPMPNRTVLPPLLGALAARGVPDAHVTLLCATGTHRQATLAEMEELIGADLLARYRVVDHSASSDEHVPVGAVDGVPIRLQREYVEADVRIITGFVEPHFFAGFSGGPKAVCPGLAALETILEAHHPRRIADPRATFVTRLGNPVHDFVRAAVALAPPHLSVDVTINRERAVTAVFAGPLTETHDAACAFAESSAVQRVPAAFDVVVSTNGGHPLDRNLYQAVKGMAAAERIVVDGGDIVMAAMCGDGVPDDGAFARLVAGARDAGDLLHASGGPELDVWQAQVLGRVLQRADVHLFSDGLSDASTRRALLHPVTDLTGAVQDAVARHGAAARVAVLPEGPLTVATVLP
ncbi:MAG TPA: nickel-dependent lactate racemase [Acidimicrobiales bacterium]|jgi:nickel-dependent lactate racemase